MKELSERTKREMAAGAKARIRFMLELDSRKPQVFTMFGNRVQVHAIDGDEVTVEVTSSANGKTVLLKEDVRQFPSDALAAQIMMVAG